ncbi:ribonuclease HIII [Puniceicoccales bacterium CK1056]|uniref:Ribonuclease n=1 Tax=Oceanipulchritudo coccoides TaxID=2706888 RepID=A0A6B2M336_9BACT|nr:ribonuclease HIII [Oceanipulchritudo coccoides]NDV62487.1 ribonuclease HIII [Oceanipulchritudo coccoides]
MKKKKSGDGDEPAKKTIYTITLDADQLEKLESICDKRLYGYYHVDHSLFAFKAPFEQVNIVAYKSGKVVIQGKGTESFVQNILEAEVTGQPLMGYEEFHNPEWFEPHAGVDEAGKGDLFGPLVSCCVIADGDMVRHWQSEGVKDSKSLTDGSILRLEKIILRTKGVVVKKTFANMNRYNELMSKPGANLNKLLAWYHARSVAAALEKRTVEWGLLDQFSKAPLTQQQLKKDGVDFDLKMRTKAESDPVVAAASICARAEFVKQLRKLSTEFGEELKKGSGAPAKKQGEELVAKLGGHRLKDFAKVHFKTAYEILGLPVPKKPSYFK